MHLYTKFENPISISLGCIREHILTPVVLKSRLMSPILELVWDILVLNNPRCIFLTWYFYKDYIYIQYRPLVTFLGTPLFCSMGFSICSRNPQYPEETYGIRIVIQTNTTDNLIRHTMLLMYFGTEMKYNRSVIMGQIIMQISI